MGYGGAGNVIVKFDTTTVNSGAMPTSWTDKDLSSVVGAKQSIVCLSVANNAHVNGIGVRTNGETLDLNAGVNFIAANKDGELIVTTDSAGVIEWIDVGATHSVTIKMKWYIQNRL